MKLFRLLIVVGALLVSADSGEETDLNPDGAGEPSVGSEVNHKGTRVDCLEALNEARNKAGLPNFSDPQIDGDRLPIVNSTYEETPGGGSVERDVISGGELETAEQKEKEFLNSFCTVLVKQEKAGVYEKQAKGTYMYVSQDSPDESCAAAVEYWKGAEDKFPSPPPAYTTEEPIYRDDRNVSFVGLFNPKPNPTVDCAIISCQLESSEESDDDVVEKEEEEKEESEDTLHAVEAQPNAREEPSVKEFKHSLLCLSSPAAFEDSKLPFTQDQWDKITGAENSTPHPIAYAAIAFAAAEVGRALQDGPPGTDVSQPEGEPPKNTLTHVGTAVGSWRSAVTNFPDFPPAYTAENPLYQKRENVSLVGLFNPGKDATVDCAVITCQPQASTQEEEDNVDNDNNDNDDEMYRFREPHQTNASSAGSSPEGKDDKEAASLLADSGESATVKRRSSDKSDKSPVHSLLCLSSPEALRTDAPPFT
ncbi:hypothetical protein Emed_000894 [Eimeria media]